MNRINALAAVTVAALCPVISSSAQIAVLNDGVAERSTVPGQSYQARLLVRNMTNEPQQARIYQTDYVYFADGRTIYGQPGTTPRSNAKWVSVSPSIVALAPGATVPVAYTVTVPADQSLTGTFWSAIMVEAVTSPTAGAAREANTRVQMGLSVITRYATQIATDIGTTGVSKVAFDSLTATTDSTGGRGLRFDFINTGERAHRFTMSLELYNEAGELIKKASQSRGLLYPGNSARQMFAVGAIDHGTYTAILVADAGGDQVFGGQFKVTY